MHSSTINNYKKVEGKRKRKEQKMDEQEDSDEV